MRARRSRPDAQPRARAFVTPRSVRRRSGSGRQSSARTRQPWPTLAHIERPYRIRLLVIPTDSVTADNYLAAEKLAPVVSLSTVANIDEGIAMCRALLDIDGTGHTAIIHTRRRRPDPALRDGDPSQPHPGQLSATQGLMGLTTGSGPVDDAGMRHMGRHLHDQQRHLQGSAEHQAGGLLHPRSTGQ